MHMCVLEIVCLATNASVSVLCSAMLCFFMLCCVVLCCVVFCNDCCLFLDRLDLRCTFRRYTVLQSLQRLLPFVHVICKLLEHHFDTCLQTAGAVVKTASALAKCMLGQQHIADMNQLRAHGVGLMHYMCQRSYALLFVHYSMRHEHHVRNCAEAIQPLL